jgi:hypothetical protein
VLKVDRNTLQLSPLKLKELSDLGFTERGHLQQMIRRSPEVFFAEIGEDLLLLGEEVVPAEIVDDRIDLLAVDRDGAVVVIELKRKSHKLHLLQALSYAAMISGWTPERLSQLRSELEAGEGAEDLEEFLASELSVVNQRQRVILIAEQYDWEVLATAEWLSEKHSVDIRCYRLVIATDAGAQYLSCECIYPPRELAEHARRRSRRALTDEGHVWQTWDQALEDVQNEDLVKFFRAELGRDQEAYLRKRLLYYRIGAKRRYSLNARRKVAYVWQTGRFPGDIDFWSSRVKADEVKEVRDGEGLRFFVETAEELERFRKAVSEELTAEMFEG